MYGGEQFIQLGDVRLRLRVEGTGPALLLLHGWALDAAMWQPQFVAFPQYRLIAIDRRGFGRSSGQPDLAREIDDVSMLLDALAIERAAILGMSQGARVALGIAQKYSQRVDRLILDGPPHFIHAAMDEVPVAHYRKLVQGDGLPAFRKQWQQHPFMRLHGGEARMHSLVSEMVARYPGRDLQHQDVAPVALEPDLSSIETPTLIVNGELDLPTRLLAGIELTQRLPNARHALVHDAGHLPNLDNPESYNGLVRSFMHDDAAAPVTGPA